MHNRSPWFFTTSRDIARQTTSASLTGPLSAIPRAGPASPHRAGSFRMSERDGNQQPISPKSTGRQTVRPRAA